MLKTLALAGAAAFALAGAATAQTMRHDMPMNGDGMDMTHDFVKKAAASDKFEVTEGQLASSRGKSSDVRRFGSMMVKDHTKSTMKIKAAVRQSMGHNPPPPMLMPEQARMVSELRSARGRDFDRIYVDQQLQAHQMALDLMQSYASGGSDPALRSTAGEIVPVVQHHLEMLRDMQRGMR